MKITVREGKRKAGRFSVSVPENQIARLESAIAYLVDNGGGSISQVIIRAIMDAAERAGWKYTKPSL